MTTKSGVTGKTVDQLARSVAAAQRDVTYAARSAAEQITELNGRPGNATKERRRLAE